VGFVVDKVALGKVSPANLHSTNCSTITIIHHLGLVQQSSSGRSTKWTQSHPTKNKNKKDKNNKYGVVQESAGGL
jgi:hypothetical protein